MRTTVKSGTCVTMAMAAATPPNMCLEAFTPDARIVEEVGRSYEQPVASTITTATSSSSTSTSSSHLDDTALADSQPSPKSLTKEAENLAIESTTTTTTSQTQTVEVEERSANATPFDLRVDGTVHANSSAPLELAPTQRTDDSASSQETVALESNPSPSTDVAMSQDASSPTERNPTPLPAEFMAPSKPVRSPSPTVAETKAQSVSTSDNSGLIRDAAPSGDVTKAESNNVRKETSIINQARVEGSDALTMDVVLDATRSSAPPHVEDLLPLARQETDVDMVDKETYSREKDQFAPASPSSSSNSPPVASSSSQEEPNSSPPTNVVKEVVMGGVEVSEQPNTSAESKDVVTPPSHKVQNESQSQVDAPQVEAPLEYSQLSHPAAAPTTPIASIVIAASTPTHFPKDSSLKEEATTTPSDAAAKSISTEKPSPGGINLKSKVVDLLKGATIKSILASKGKLSDASKDSSSHLHSQSHPSDNATTTTNLALPLVVSYKTMSPLPSIPFFHNVHDGSYQSELHLAASEGMRGSEDHSNHSFLRIGSYEDGSLLSENFDAYFKSPTGGPDGDALGNGGGGGTVSTDEDDFGADFRGLDDTPVSAIYDPSLVLRTRSPEAMPPIDLMAPVQRKPVSFSLQSSASAAALASAADCTNGDSPALVNLQHSPNSVGTSPLAQAPAPLAASSSSSSSSSASASVALSTSNSATTPSLSSSSATSELGIGNELSSSSSSSSSSTVTTNSSSTASTSAASASTSTSTPPAAAPLPPSQPLVAETELRTAYVKSALAARRMPNLPVHMYYCKQGACKVVGCVDARIFLEHMQTCRDPRCLPCVDARVEMSYELLGASQAKSGRNNVQKQNRLAEDIALKSSKLSELEASLKRAEDRDES